MTDRIDSIWQQGYKATATFLRYYIHQNYEKGATSSRSTSRETSDLSADESDYSPCHVCSCDSNADMSDEEHDRVSCSSQTSRSTKSPSKSLGSLTTRTVEFDVHPAPDNLSAEEEVVVAELHISASADGAGVDNQDIEALQSLSMNESASQQTSPSISLPSLPSQDVSEALP